MYRVIALKFVVMVTRNCVISELSADCYITFHISRRKCVDGKICYIEVRKCHVSCTLPTDRLLFRFVCVSGGQRKCLQLYMLHRYSRASCWKTQILTATVGCSVVSFPPGRTGNLFGSLIQNVSDLVQNVPKSDNTVIFTVLRKFTVRSVIGFLREILIVTSYKTICKDQYTCMQ
jgi:hypothetical protein